MAEGLSKDVMATIHLYYLHRERQQRNGWNKEEDLERIFEVANKEGWTVEAVAGKFWFSKKVVLGRHIIEVTERTLSVGGISNIQDTGKPLGALSDLANALRKSAGRLKVIEVKDTYTDSQRREGR